MLALERVTCAPLAGAAALNVTVPVEDCAPPVTLVGLSETDERETAGAEVGACSKSKTAGFGSFDETTTNFVAEII